MAALDLSANVDAFATHTITRRRRTPGAVSGGRYGAGSTSTASMLAVVCPVPGAVAERLGLGARANDARTVLVADDLLTTDELVIDGAEYAVVDLGDWQAAGAFAGAVCTRRDAA